MVGVPSSCALLGGFVISLLWQYSAECEMSASACTRSMPGFFCWEAGVWLAAHFCHSFLSSAVILRATYFPFIRSLSRCILFLPCLAYLHILPSVISHSDGSCLSTHRNHSCLHFPTLVCISILLSVFLVKDAWFICCRQFSFSLVMR